MSTRNLLFFSVIIPTFNRKQLLLKTLEGLEKQSISHDIFEVIVVDDGSNDGTLEHLNQNSFKFALTFLRQSNQGPAAARNNGAEKAAGTVLAFIDDDAIPCENWLKNALISLKNASPRDAGIEGAVHPMANQVPGPMDHVVKNVSGKTYLTCNMFYFKRIFEELGGFDFKNFPYIQEDSDLAFSAFSKNYFIPFDPKIKVFHPIQRKNATYFFKQAGKWALYAPLFQKKHQKFIKTADPKMRQKVIIAPRYYYFCYLGLILFISNFHKTGFILFCFGTLLTLFARLRRRKFTPKSDLILAVAIWTIMPYIRLYYIIKGSIKNRYFYFYL